MAYPGSHAQQAASRHYAYGGPPARSAIGRLASALGSLITLAVVVGIGLFVLHRVSPASYDQVLAWIDTAYKWISSRL